MTQASYLADPLQTTELAAALNEAMRVDASARARYLALWGVEWVPLGSGACGEIRCDTRSSTAPTRF